MNTGDALLRACLENPDDDTPRLVYADWLQENGDADRAEFIRLQITIDRHWYTGDIPPGVKDRESDLLAAHEAQWNPLPPLLRKSGYFDRGFIDHVDVATDEQAAALAHCPEVLQVSAGGEGFTDAGLTHLAKLPYLEELSLHATTFTAEGMRPLARLPFLRRLSLQNGAAITGEWFRHFRNTPRLVRLRTYSSWHDEATPEEWAAWEAARAKRFRKSPPDEQKRAARAFLFDEQEYGWWQGDKRLRLIQCRISDADLELLAALPGLQNLDVDETDVTRHGLRYLSGCPELHTLGLGNNDIDNIDGLAGMTQLRDLDVGCMYVHRRDGTTERPLTDAGTAALTTLTGLESLCLSFNPITDATLAHLAGLKNLRKLELESVGGVTDAGLRHLRGLKKLEHLDVTRTAVTKSGAKELRKHLPRLKIKGG